MTKFVAFSNISWKILVRSANCNIQKLWKILGPYKFGGCHFERLEICGLIDKHEFNILPKFNMFRFAHFQFAGGVKFRVNKQSWSWISSSISISNINCCNGCWLISMLNLIKYLRQLKLTTQGKNSSFWQFYHRFFLFLANWLDFSHDITIFDHF